MNQTGPNSRNSEEDDFSEVKLLTTVFSSAEAAILEAALTGYGIPYFCQGRAFSSLGLGMPEDMGGIGFYVPTSVAEEAKALLASFDEPA